MRKIKKVNEDYNKIKIEIICSYTAGEELIRLMDYFKSLGSIGHTVDFQVDGKTFTFDGDGNHKIFNIRKGE